MAKFISVLDTNMNMSFWQAVQWDDDLSSLQNNQFYTAGVNKSLPKHNGDKQVGHKSVIETSTQLPGGAIMIQLSVASQNLLALASNKASASVMAKLTKKAKKPAKPDSD